MTSSEYIAPGTPPEGELSVRPDLLGDFADKVIEESLEVGDVRELLGIAQAKEAVPGAELISGCIAFRQPTEDMITDLYGEMSQLYLDIHDGLRTIVQADQDNAASVGQAGCK